MALVFLLIFALLRCGSGHAEDLTNSSNSSNSTDCFIDSDVVFLVDESGSIYPNDFRDVKDFVWSVVNRLSLGPNRTRVGLVKFSDRPTSLMSLDQGYSRSAVDQALRGMVQHGGGSITGAALIFVVRHIFSGSSRPKVLILITDGMSQDDVNQAIRELRRHRVHTYVIGFGGRDLSGMLLVGSSPRHFYQVSSTKTLLSLLNQLCSPDLQCDATVKADIMLMLDMSWRFGWSEEAVLMMNFLSRVVSVFNIGPERVQIGLVQFREDSTTEWNLNAHPNKTSLLQAVTDLQYKEGNTTAGNPLNYILQNHVCPTAGLRDDARKIGVFITDSKPQDEIGVSGQNLRDSGIELYAIGVGKINVTELLSVVSDPDEIHMFKVSNLFSLVNIMDNVIVNLCSSARGAWPAATSDLTPSLPSVSSGWVSPPSPLGPLPSVGAPPQDGGPVLVQWGLDFTVSCFVKTHSLDGYFLLLTPFGNHTLPAVNHSAHFLFPPFSPTHSGLYTCVYLLQVGCRNLTFNGPALHLKLGVSDSELLVRAAVIFLPLLIYTITLYYYYYYKPKVHQSTRGQRRARADQSLRVL